MGTTPDDRVHRLQILVGSDGDREALQTMLKERYEVSINDELEAVDCLVIDERLLAEYRGKIRRLKAEAHPTFQPVLLLQQSPTGSQQWDAVADDSDDPPLVDEIATAPIDRDTLYRRLENLLVRRRQSAELSAQYKTVQQRFKRLFNATNDAIFVIDPGENKITECNPAAAELVGQSRTALLGTAPSDLFTTDSTTTEAFINSVVETGENWSDEFVCERDTETRQIEISATSFDTADENTVLFSIRDVTERKAYQSELELKTHAIESAPIGITISDPNQPDNPLIYTNEGFTTITGYSSEDILGKNCRFLQGPGTREEPVETLRNAINNEESVTVELRNYRKDGTPFWNRVNVAPVENEDGEVVNFVGFQEDVSDRKEREITLQLFRKAVETSANAVIITDHNGNIEYVNPAFEAQTGYSRSEVQATNPNILNSGQQSDGFYDALWETVLDGEMWRAELINQRKSGELYRIEQEISPIKNSVGEITHFVAIERDVTDRRLREQQLAVLNRILRHNLRNGINVIQGNAELLAETITDEQARQFVAAIRERASDLSELSEKATTVRTLFDQDQPQTTIYPVEELFADVESQVVATHPAVTLEQTITGDLAVTGDSRLQLGLVELINYTLEYNERTDPIVSLTAAPDTERNEEWITTAVTDNGSGIPKHEWKPIASGEETPLEHGTGLGLWLVHWTVSLLGGEVSIESAGDGTRVVLTLPRAQMADGED